MDLKQKVQESAYILDWLIKVLHEWPARKVFRCYIAFLAIAVLLAGMGDYSADVQESRWTDYVFLVALGPVWMLGGSIVCPFIIGQLQLALIDVLDRKTESAMRLKKGIAEARRNSFYYNWIAILHERGSTGRSPKT